MERCQARVFVCSDHPIELATSTPSVGCPPQCWGGNGGAVGHGPLPLHPQEAGSKQHHRCVGAHSHDLSHKSHIQHSPASKNGSEGTGKLLGFGDSSGPAAPSSWVLWPMFND